MKNCKPIGSSEQEIWEVGELIAERVLAAQNAKDFPAFSADFTPRLRELLTESLFLETTSRFEKEYGFYQERRRACTLRNVTHTSIIWVIKFNKTPQEFLFQLRMCEKNGKPLVDSVLIRTELS